MLKQHPLRLSLALALPIAMALAGLWALTQLPDGARVPIHFDAAGQANGWADARWGLFLVPLLTLFTAGMILVLPLIDPRGDKLRQSWRATLNILLAVEVLLAAVQAMIILSALGQQPDVGRWMLLMVGGLFAVIGNMLGKVRWNYTVGIRTPWTLANERVWDKTHRFGGVVFVVAGLTLIAAALLAVPSDLGVPLLITTTIVCTVLCVGKSWLVWRAESAP